MRQKQSERIPHMGWSPLYVNKDSPLLTSLTPNAWVYFVHSFAATPKDPSTISASVKFNTFFCTHCLLKNVPI